MPLIDLAGYLDDDSLEIPGVVSRRHPKGHTYTVPSPDARTGLWLEAVAGIGMKAAAGGQLTEADGANLSSQLSDTDERTLYERSLGSAFDELVSDGVSWAHIGVLGKYAFLYWTMGKDGADSAMAAEQAGPPNREARRAGQKSSRSRASKATATRTPRQGSIAGTTSAPRSRPRKAAASS